MFALRTAITSFVLIVSFTHFAPTLADNCLPYRYYPPTAPVGAGEVVVDQIDIDHDGTPELLSRYGVYAYSPDNQGGLIPIRLLNTSLHILDIAPGYLGFDHDLDIASIAKSNEYDYYALYFKSEGPDQRLLEDVAYLGDKDHIGGAVAHLPSGSELYPYGQLIYLVNESGACNIHTRVIGPSGFATFTQPTQLDFEAYSPQLVDLNNDGHLDLLVRSASGEIVTFLRNALTIAGDIDASFPIASYTPPRFVDYDGDQIPELTFVDGPYLRIFRRDSEGYAEWRTYDHMRNLRIVGQGDVDNDGDIDFIIDDGSCTNPSGNPGCVRILQQTDIATFVSSTSMQSSALPTGAAVVDLNADELPDIAIFAGAGVTFHIADGPGEFPPPLSLGLNTNVIGSPGLLTTLDANHDGLDDILVSQSSGGGTFIVENHGDGEFSQQIYQTTYAPKVTRVADMDEDGSDDVVCVIDTSTTPVVIGYGAPDGTLGPFDSDPAWEARLSTGVDVGDINGDGHLDIACVQFSYDRLTILLGNGDRTFRAPLVFDTGDGPTNVRVADFNNDGLDDVVTGNYRAGSFSVFLASAPETLSYHYGTWARFGNGVSADIEVADFDQDGFVDLVTPSGSWGPELRWGNGGAYFTYHDELDAPAGTDSLHLADLNRDGLTDIVCFNDGAKTISAYLNLGNRAFAAPVQFAVPSPVRGLCIGDFDGLGDLDFVINNGHGLYHYFADTCELESAVPGDTNADGLLTPDDVPGFVAILLDLGGSPGARKAADMNQDGLNDATDITLFVACLLNGGCE